MNKNKITLIAEIGWNHMGNMKIAEKMIKEAKKSGADYAKFQTWSVNNLTPGPWDEDGRRQIYEKAELKFNHYQKLIKICKKNKIKFLTSLFSTSDYEVIKSFKFDSIKIPSPENRNAPLIKFCDKKFKKLYLSTGAARVSEISKSLELIKNKSKTHIMHCVSSYPCEDKIVNLDRINDLSKLSKNIGLSDHTPDILSSLFSLPYGVSVIEKHFTIDNNLPGRDNKFAILPKELAKLREGCDRYISMIIKNKSLLKSDHEIRKVYSGRWGQ